MKDTFILVLAVVLMRARGDSVGCFVRDSCVLPCTFKPGHDAVIHWIQMGGEEEIYVHTYYNGNDQLSLQKDRFRSRTSLFKDQIQRGNASLLLSRVEVQDQGRYKCYTSIIDNNDELFIDVTAEAPVREVNIRWVENKITCMSEGIYPEPELTWTTSPLSHLSPPDRPTVQQTEQQLYSISSSLTVSDGSIDSYSCVVSAGNSRRKVTIFKPTKIRAWLSETTIPCTASNTPHAGLRWRFNHAEEILTQSRSDGSIHVSEQWRQQVEEEGLKSGHLTLRHLSPKHDGLYTCEVDTDEETHVSSTFLTVEEPDKDNLSAGSIAGIVMTAVVTVAVVVAVIVIFFIYQRCKRKQTGTGKGTEDVQQMYFETEICQTLSAESEMKNKPKTMAEQMSSAGDSSMLTMNRFIRGNILSPTEKTKSSGVKGRHVLHEDMKTGGREQGRAPGIPSHRGAAVPSSSDRKGSRHTEHGALRPQSSTRRADHGEAEAPHPKNRVFV